MMDPLARNQIEMGISLLADPEIDMALRAGERSWQIVFTRRRGKRNDPDHRYRDPDRA